MVFDDFDEELSTLRASRFFFLVQKKNEVKVCLARMAEILL